MVGRKYVCTKSIQFYSSRPHLFENSRNEMPQDLLPYQATLKIFMKHFKVTYLAALNYYLCTEQNLFTELN